MIISSAQASFARARLLELLRDLECADELFLADAASLRSDIANMYVARRAPLAKPGIAWWTFRHFGRNYLYEPASNLLFRAGDGFLGASFSDEVAAVDIGLLAEPARACLEAVSNRVMDWKQYRVAPPIHGSRKASAVSINFAGRCNLACDYCFNDQGRYGNGAEAGNGQFRIDKILQFLMKSPDLEDSIQVICFGGEPLLAVRRIKRLIEEYRAWQEPKRSLSFAINTNGTLLKGEAIELLDQHFDSVGVSLDLDAHRHDMDRPFIGGVGSSNAILKNLRALPDSLRKKISLEIVFTSPDIDFEAYEGKVKEMGVRYADFGPVQGLRFALAWKQDEVDAYVRNLERFYFKRLGRFRAAGLRLVSLPVEALGLRFGRPIARKCGAGRQVVSIGTDGKIGGCWAFQGDANFHLGDAWSPSQSLDSLKRAKLDEMLNPHQDDECSACMAVNTCGGHCTAMRKNEPTFRERCHFLRKTSSLQLSLRDAMTEDDATYVEGLHFDH